MPELKSLLTEQLLPKLEGKIIFPDDLLYDKARMVVTGEVDARPGALVRVANAADVQATIHFVTQNKIDFAVRSGGHSFAGYSNVNDGVVIDLREMKKIEVNPTDKTVWIEAGVTAIEATNETDKHDLAIGFGDTGSVGVSGITLGGGVGFLVRKFGLAIDHLLAAQIVTADGKILDIDAQNYPDLFWAIRGGGGNFGVVTKLKFDLQPLSQVIGGMMILPAEPKVLADSMAMLDKAPRELSAIYNVMPTPPMPFLPAELHGKMCIMALMVYAGDPVEGEKVLAPFRNLTKPWADMIKPMRYREIFFPDDDSHHPKATSHTMMMDHVDLELAEKIIHQLETMQAPMRVVQLRMLGGAMADVGELETAYAHRKSKIMTNIAAFYETPEEKTTRLTWVREMSKMLFQGDDGVYVGFLNKDNEDLIKFAYPAETMKKLKEVKQKYDPENLFHHNLNIR